MRAGTLNRYIEIQKKSGLKDGAGQELPDDWLPVFKVWSWHKPLSGRAGLSGNVMTSITGNSWRIRYGAAGLSIHVGMRVVYSGRVFDITRIDVDYANRDYIDLICEEGGSNG